MKRWYYIHNLLLLLAFFFESYGQQIQAIRFEGLKRCKPGFFDHCIESKKKSKIDSTTILKDLRNIRNTNLFTEVYCEIRDSAGQKILVYHVDEKLTFLPSFKGGASRESYWFQIGIIDFHFLGKGIQFAGFIKYQDRLSIFGYLNAFHLNDSKWGITLQYNFLNSIEQVKISGFINNYFQKRKNIELLVSREVNYRNYVFAGLAYDYNTYLNSESGVTHERQEKNLLVVRHLNEHNLDFFPVNQSGWANDLKASVDINPKSKRRYWRIENRFRYIKVYHKKINWANQIITAISEKDESVFAPFVLDNFLNMRGIGDRAEKPDAHFTLNTEIRYLLFETQRIAFQSAWFLDFSAFQLPAGQSATAKPELQNRFYSGPGIRFIHKRIAALVLRLDYALPGHSEKGGLFFGVGQFF